ncbi:hypothetical protein L1987_37078 [Smallanthus sonchifolius]|uniref:Uncharacterized protein n=1 Tax=Smallanthus sonchifolius TaxID=185202 RepID=A0ACB9HGL9_9ASTR|nr:hypothetical protein L1987_37078 [Smallanthus sonchifolius]
MCVLKKMFEGKTKDIDVYNYKTEEELENGHLDRYFRHLIDPLTNKGKEVMEETITEMYNREVDRLMKGKDVTRDNEGIRIEPGASHSRSDSFHPHTEVCVTEGMGSESEAKGIGVKEVEGW